MTTDPVNFYNIWLDKHRITLTHLINNRSKLGYARLTVFILTILTCYYTFSQYGLLGLISLALGLCILLYLVSLDVNNNAAIRHQERLVEICSEELQVLKHKFQHRFSGDGLQPHDHPYSNDLDLFGHASIFQWLNRASTEGGRKLLAEGLLHSLPKEGILQRQKAVEELSAAVPALQQFQSHAQSTPLSLSTEEKILQWSSTPNTIFRQKGWKVFIPLYSLLALGSLLAAILDYIPWSIFSSLYILFFITAIVLSRNTIKPYVLLSGAVEQVASLEKMMRWIELQPFRSDHLLAIQQSIHSKHKASKEIAALKSILDKFDLRLSIVGMLFFNPFLLWDIRQMMALNRWKNNNAAVIPHWFRAIAEMEVLISLAITRFNQPGWTQPILVDQHCTLEGSDIGHPLINTANRVNNSFALTGEGKIALVTGSNMAGKSTFLRSLGVNIVLAQMGSMVCAQSFRLSPLQLMSSMRIADDLSENTSTFYAELKKLKGIIEAVKRKEKLFILLDEILRGTNSLDRHTGSEALIRQLIREHALAVIATHDVELARLHDEYPEALTNYHFDVQVAGEELYFDYKLKNGVCQSLNASILMRKIGIEMS